MINNENQKPENEVLAIKQHVEKILREKFGQNVISKLNYNLSLLSTKPDQVDSQVDENFLYGMCGTFSEALHEALIDEGIMADKKLSEAKDLSAHTYLSITTDTGTEIIVDITIGQFIKGHNHAFVGTREQLKDLVENQTGEGKPYQIIHTSQPSRAYERIWGHKGKVTLSAKKALEIKRVP